MPVKNKNLKKNREVFVLEGIKEIEEVLRENRFKICNVFFHKKITKHKKFINLKDLLERSNISLVEIGDKKLKQLSSTKNPQGILAEIKMFKYTLDDLKKNANLIVVLDNIQDPGNLGSCVRSCSIFGVDGLILSKGCARLSNNKVLRGIKGYLGDFPIVEDVDMKDIIKYLKYNKLKVFAADIEGNNLFDNSFNIEKHTAIILGSEGQGLSDVINDKVERLSIPMKKPGQSLNVAVSCGIILFEVKRRWI